MIQIWSHSGQSLGLWDPKFNSTWQLAVPKVAARFREVEPRAESAEPCAPAESWISIQDKLPAQNGPHCLIATIPLGVQDPRSRLGYSTVNIACPTANKMARFVTQRPSGPSRP